MWLPDAPFTGPSWFKTINAELFQGYSHWHLHFLESAATAAVKNLANTFVFFHWSARNTGGRRGAVAVMQRWCAGGVCRWCVQVVCAGGVCRWCVQVVCTGGVCRWCVQVVCAAGVCSWCVQVVRHSSALITGGRQLVRRWCHRSTRWCQHSASMR